MIKIKICGITRIEDARYAIKAGADALGLIFAPSKRQVNFGQAQKIVAVVPPTVLTFGVFVNQDPKWIKQLVGQLGLDRIQFHGQEKADDLKQFPKNRVIKAFNPKEHAIVPKHDPAKDAGAFLIDAFIPGQVGGTGQVANWAYAKKIKSFGKTLILSGGLKSNNVEEAIRIVKPDMVDVSSGVEDEPGIKSYNKIKRFINTVRTFN